MRAPACFEDREASRLIRKVCEEQNIDPTLLADLCGVIQSYSGSGRKDGVISDFTSHIDGFMERSSSKRGG